MLSLGAFLSVRGSLWGSFWAPAGVNITFLGNIFKKEKCQGHRRNFFSHPFPSLYQGCYFRELILKVATRESYNVLLFGWQFMGKIFIYYALFSIASFRYHLLFSSENQYNPTPSISRRRKIVISYLKPLRPKSSDYQILNWNFPSNAIYSVIRAFFTFFSGKESK